jgi:hypothetical protein
MAHQGQLDIGPQLRLTQPTFGLANLAVVPDFVYKSKGGFGIEVVVLVLVEFAALDDVDPALSIFYQLFLAIVYPLFDMVQAIATSTQKFGVNVGS